MLEHLMPLPRKVETDILDLAATPAAVWDHIRHADLGDTPFDATDETSWAKFTRLHVRARAAFPPSKRLHVAWIRPVHSMMQRSQLRHLAARAEGKLARDTLGDIGDGVAGAAIMILAWLTPFLRPKRGQWGLSAQEARLPRPGDELVADPRWSWTHAVEVDAPAGRVWPWVAQIGADRGGFYSYH